MHENRADHGMCCEITNHGPPRPVPHMYDANERFGFVRHERPFDFHPRCYPMNVPKANRAVRRARRGGHTHERRPLRGPIDGAERAVGRHLNRSPAVGSTLEKANVAVVSQMNRPALDIGGERKNPGSGRANQSFVDRLQRSIGRHRSEVVRRVCHALTGVQRAVSLKPRRRLTCGVAPVALLT